MFKCLVKISKTHGLTFQKNRKKIAKCITPTIHTYYQQSFMIMKKNEVKKYGVFRQIQKKGGTSN